MERALQKLSLAGTRCRNVAAALYGRDLQRQLGLGLRPHDYACEVYFVAASLSHDCQKAFIGRRPKSTYRITRSGRAALRNYLAQMQRLIDAMPTRPK